MGGMAMMTQNTFRAHKMSPRRAERITEIKTFNDALKAAREVFSASLTNKQASDLAALLRSSGKLGFGVVRSYFPQVVKLGSERQHLIARLLGEFYEDGHDFLPLMPMLLSFVNCNSRPIRNCIVHIICQLREDSTLAENTALGCLRNPDSEIRYLGAKIIESIFPFCGGGLKQRVKDMLPDLAEDMAVSDMLNAVISRESAPAKQRDAATLRPHNFTGKSILVAEDDEQIRRLMHKVLGNTGARVHEACDGDEAIRIVDDCNSQGRRFDLAILDLRMPGQNGIHVLEHLRKYYDHKQTPAIILTAVKDKNLAMTAMQKYNIHSYLIKPVPLNDLYLRISQAMDSPAEAAIPGDAR